jgi:prephenate dehydratase
MTDRWRHDRDALRERLRPLGGEQAVVAFQGEAGANGQLAIDALWGARAWVLPCRTFTEVIASVERGDADFAVLPVRNEIIGAIAGVREAMEEARLDVLGEVRQEVRHALLGVKGATIEAVTDVFSHPAALAQCRDFLSRHPRMVPREAYDTAGAAREVAARAHRHESAIADEGCAARYGLQLLARGVGDRQDNATWFAVVRRAGR